MLVHHLEEIDEQFNEVQSRMELINLRLEEISFKPVFHTGFGTVLAKPVRGREQCHGRSYNVDPNTGLGSGCEDKVALRDGRLNTWV